MNPGDFNDFNDLETVGNGSQVVANGAAIDAVEVPRGTDDTTTVRVASCFVVDDLDIARDGTTVIPWQA
jgi:hypothetical protein